MRDAKEKKSLDDRMGAKSDSVSNIRFPVAASERAPWIMMAGFTHGPLRRSTKIAHFIDRCRNHASRSVAELAS